MTQIVTPITNDPVTGNTREAEAFRVEFDKDFDVNIEIDIYEKNQQGQRLFDVAKTLTGQQRDASMQKHFPIRRFYTTKGSQVNAQGQVVENGPIAERDFIFAITNDQLLALTGKTGSDSAMETIQKFVELKIQEISNRGQN